MKRLTTQMTMEVYEKLKGLAGGERKIGKYIADHVEAATALDVPDRLDMEILRDRLYALSGKVSGLESEVIMNKRTISAMIANDH